MNYWFYRFNIIDWRVMDIVLVFIDSQLWHKKLKQQNLLSLFGDKKINQNRNKLSNKISREIWFSSTNQLPIIIMDE